MGDGAYDTFAAYERAEREGFKLVTPPRDNAVVHSDSKLPHIQTRNNHVAYTQEKGIYAWAAKNDYWQRNRVETTMSRYVTKLQPATADDIYQVSLGRTMGFGVTKPQGKCIGFARTKKCHRSLILNRLALDADDLRWDRHLD